MMSYFSHQLPRKPRLLLRFGCWLALLALPACAPQRPFYHPQAAQWAQRQPEAGPIAHQIFLVGDAGKPAHEPLEPTLALLQQALRQAQAPASVVFLGDNIYPRGLPDAQHPQYAQAAAHLQAQIEVAKAASAQAVFVPGNHDWDKMGPDGLERVRRQEAFVQEALGREQAFLPQNGCPGPAEVPLGPHAVLLVIDTQWWLHEWDRGGEEDGCEVASDWDFLIQLEAALRRHEGKRILVAAHHPLFSNGLHGGHVKPTTHLFPLTDLKKNLYVPLPGLGSVYAFYRTVIGSRQDIPNPRFRKLKDALLRLFDQHPNLVYVSGHEHNLQYFQHGSQHYVVSGAGCKQTYTTHRDKAQFAAGQKGFARIDLHEDGEAWLHFFSPNADGTALDTLFRQHLGQVQAPAPKAAAEGAVSSPPYHQAQGSAQLDASGLKSWLLGRNYRAEWAAQLDSIPVLDIDTAYGGLEIVQRGGGMQTKSLRLQASDGRQYALRTIEKFPESAVPDALRGTVGEEVVKDQISASHPYAALAVPVLAEAAGVYHTNPRLVWLPDSPRLGEHRADFGGRLYLFEERPSGEVWQEAAHFGKPRDIVSTDKVLKKLRKDNDNYVDQAFVAKSRLFDIWIGDWDRHEDQWRWAEFRDGEGDRFFRPIPRDRDQAFFFSDGLLMKIGTRRWGIRKFQGFHDRIRDVEGLGFNARYFDRSFLTEPSLEVWEKAAGELQASLTDETIDRALRQLPQAVRDLHGAEIARKLRQRRADLVEYARRYYTFLAQTVEVVGSDKHEHFAVSHLEGGKVRVTVRKRKKDGTLGKQLYQRTFLPKETGEIRLFGLGGEDVFEVEGKSQGRIRVRVVGGEGDDALRQQASAATRLYDTPDTEATGPGIRDRRSEAPGINDYDRKAFRYNARKPLANFSFNPDDGVFVGGGILFERQGFRKTPYASRHTIKANYAPRTASYSFLYKSEWRRVLGKWDAVLEADLRVPSFTNFYYGLGNDTRRAPDATQAFYRVRYGQYDLHPQLRRQSSNERHTFSVGAYFQWIEFEEAQPGERYVAEDAASKDLIEKDLWFSAISASYIADTRDRKSMPTRGILFRADFRRSEGDLPEVGGSEREISYTRVQGDFASYFRLGQTNRAVLAVRAGGAHNWGRFLFFQANTLGGEANLRGFSRMRFAGRSAAFQNTELRLKLFDFYTPLFPGAFGVMGLHDIGRVWADGEESDTWHRGYGGGIWMAPFEALSLSVDYTRGSEGNRLFVRFGFMF